MKEVEIEHVKIDTANEKLETTLQIEIGFVLDKPTEDDKAKLNKDIEKR